VFVFLTFNLLNNQAKREGNPADQPPQSGGLVSLAKLDRRQPEGVSVSNLYTLNICPSLLLFDFDFNPVGLITLLAKCSEYPFIFLEG
jgi:hypothetical protein